MNMELLQEQVRALATMPETEAPVVSCYLNLEKAGQDWHKELRRRMRQLSISSHDQREQRLVDEAFSKILRFLRSGIRPGSKGAVLFARSGNTPIFLELQFPVPVPTWISVDTVPNIYHLIELKDTYHRYVVLLADNEGARIFEVNLGAVTREVWVEHPELRRRVGREWTRLHYQNHQRERGKQFLKEKIETIDGLMSASGHTHLVLAGNKRLITTLHKALPKRLAAQVIDILSLSKKTDADDIVSATIGLFIAAEERESLTMVDRLLNAVRRGDLAEIGAVECLQASIRGQVDTLVISQDHDLEVARWCDACGWVAVGEPLPTLCAECGNMSLQEHNVREELIRQAERNGCSIETVRDSNELEVLGGVGCLLRFATKSLEYRMHQQ